MNTIILCLAYGDDDDDDDDENENENDWGSGEMLYKLE
jgi:hypothetical protein